MEYLYLKKYKWFYEINLQVGQYVILMMLFLGAIKLLMMKYLQVVMRVSLSPLLKTPVLKRKQLIVKSTRIIS